MPLISLEVAEKAILLGTEKQHWYNKSAVRASDDARIALRLILYTGLRFEEVHRLKGQDLFLDAEPPHLLTTLKGRKQQTQVYLPKEAVELLRPISERDKLFFISNAGSNRMLNRGLAKLNIKFRVTAHGLRHVFANEINKNGMSLFFLQKALHHRKIETTTRYYLQDNISELGQQIDIYNTLARRGLTEADKLEAAYNQLKRWRGNDDSLTIEKLDGQIVVSTKSSHPKAS